MKVPLISMSTRQRKELKSTAVLHWSVTMSTVNNCYCMLQVTPGVRFMGEGAAVFFNDQDFFHSISFSFRTEQVAGVLVHMLQRVSDGVPDHVSIDPLHLMSN